MNAVAPVPFIFAPLTPGKYRTMAIDIPWMFSGGTKGRPQHYRRMVDAEIAALPLAQLAHPDGSNIFVWITSPIDGPRFWQKVYPGWKKQRIRYSSRGFVWVKTHARAAKNGRPLFVNLSSLHLGHGFTTRKNAEDCLLFKIGRPKRLRKDIHEIIISPIREHSRKPDEFYEEVEKYGEAPFCEVFSREPRKGWDQFGDELTKFAVVA